MLKTAPPPLDFLKETIQDRLSNAFPGLRVDVGSIRLVWHFWRINPVIRLSKMAVYDPDRPDAPIAISRQADIVLSAMDLLKQRVRPKRIDLFQPRLDLAAASSSNRPALPPSDNGVPLFQTIQVTDGLVLPITSGAPPILVPEMRLANGLSGTRLTLTAGRLDQMVDVDARSRVTDTGGSFWDIFFEGLQPPILADISPLFAHLSGLRIPIKGRCFIRLDAKGSLISIDIDIMGGKGVLSYPWLERELSVNQLAVKMEWMAPGPLFVTSCDLEFDGPSFHATGSIDWQNSLPTLALDVRAEDIDVADLGSYWPVSAEPEIRQWLVDHFASGNASNAQAQVWLVPEDFSQCRIPCDALSATVDFSNVVLDYFPPMPKLKGAAGRAVFSGCGVEIDVAHGRAANSRITGGTVSIKRFDDYPTRITINARVKGPAIDGFKAVSDLERDQASPVFSVVGGRADTRLGFDFPLQDNFDPKAFHVSVDSRAENLAIDTVWGIPLENGNASIQYQNSELTAEGAAFSFGVPLVVNWKRNMRNFQTSEMVLKVTGSPDRDAFAAWGLPLPDVIQGRTPTTAMVKIKNGVTRVNARFDLTQSQIKAGALGWKKPSGDQATLSLRMLWEPPNLLRLNQVHFYGDDFHALGSGLMRMGSSTPKLRLNLKQIHIGAHRLSADLNYGAAGVMAEVKGALFNAMPLLQLPVVRKTTSGFPMDIQLEINRILLKNGIELQNAAGRFKQKFNGRTNLSFHALTSPGEPVELALIQVQNGHRLMVGAADAGVLLKGLDLYAHASGGRLTIDGIINLDAHPQVSGTVKATDFSLREPPTLIKILSMTSFEGVVQGLRQEGAPFDYFKAQVSVDNGVVTIKDGKMEGDALGLAFAGTYDMKNRRMDIKGIVVPFNLINKAINALPILGKIITGDGIIAASYGLSGPPESPDIRVNPASALLVGRLRNLFNRLKPASGNIH